MTNKARYYWRARRQGWCREAARTLTGRADLDRALALFLLAERAAKRKR